MSTLTNYWNEMTTGDKIQALLLFLGRFNIHRVD